MNLDKWLLSRGGTQPLAKSEELPKSLIDAIRASSAGQVEIIGKKHASFDQDGYEDALRAGLRAQIGEVFSLMADGRRYRVETRWIEKPGEEEDVEKQIVLWANILVDPSQARIGDFAWQPPEHEAHRFIEFPQETWLCVA